MATKDEAIQPSGYSSGVKKVLVLGEDGETRVTSSNPLPTTASISGDINVDTSSVDTSGYIGKPSGTNADFTTAYASSTTITLSGLPSGVSQINSEDIVTIQQVNSSGSVVNTYNRDDVTISTSGTDPTTVTVSGASFAATDTFIVYTNIARPSGGGESEQTFGDSMPTKGTAIGLRAESTIPTAVDDSDIVAGNSDLYGHQRIAGYNYASGAIDINPVYDTMAQTLELIDSPLLNGVTATGASASVDASLYNKITFQYVATSVSSGATLKYQGSLDGTNWDDLQSITISASGNAITEFNDKKYKYIRANITSYTDGTYTVMAILGR